MDNNNLPESIPYIAHESEVARLERIIKRMFIICILLIVFLVGTNAYWIWYEAQFMDETITVQQENADGINNYVGRDGNIDNTQN